jgi:hypothetical protein
MPSLSDPCERQALSVGLNNLPTGPAGGAEVEGYGDVGLGKVVAALAWAAAGWPDCELAVVRAAAIRRLAG